MPSTAPTVQAQATCQVQPAAQGAGGIVQPGICLLIPQSPGCSSAPGSEQRCQPRPSETLQQRHQTMKPNRVRSCSHTQHWAHHLLVSAVLQQGRAALLVWTGGTAMSGSLPRQLQAQSKSEHGLSATAVQGGSQSSQVSLTRSDCRCGAAWPAMTVVGTQAPSSQFRLRRQGARLLLPGLPGCLLPPHPGLLPLTSRQTWSGKACTPVSTI